MKLNEKQRKSKKIKGNHKKPKKIPEVRETEGVGAGEKRTAGDLASGAE